MSALYFVVKAISDPQAPSNGGCFRPLRSTCPKAAVGTAPPAPVNGRTITMKRIADTLLGALVQAMPERIPAAPCGTCGWWCSAGTIPRAGSVSSAPISPPEGPAASRSATASTSLETDIANTMNMPAESLELNYPLRVDRNALWPDSAGAGR